MNTFKEQIQKLEQKGAQIKAQIQALRSKEHTANNKELLKKHRILGKFIMAKMENDENYSSQILIELGRSLVKPNDRILFNLQAAKTNYSDKSSTENTDQLLNS